MDTSISIKDYSVDLIVHTEHRPSYGPTGLPITETIAIHYNEFGTKKNESGKEEACSLKHCSMSMSKELAKRLGEALLLVAK